MEMKVETGLTPVIGVIEENCVNCHRCIAVCPVKYCIDGSGKTVEINHNLCIGCGHCIEACPHDARVPLDDTEAFLEALDSGEEFVAVAAPAIAANFPDEWKRLFGFLAERGVRAFYDVGFGAELTVASYLDYIKKKNPDTVIAQPCPALVSYIEIYKPNLLPHLAPADSPMAHTIKMVEEFFPEQARSRIVVLSPCLAKRREFDDVRPSALNVTFRGLDTWLKKEGVDLSKFPERDFDGPRGERAVGFSTPGGLRETVARENGEIVDRVRKIEGGDIVYPYLDSFAESLEKGVQPLLVDCLNCERGCNGGSGTLTADRTVDELETDIRRREKAARKEHKTDGAGNAKASRVMERRIREYWKPNLYSRSYKDRSGQSGIRKPIDYQLQEIYRRMRKTDKWDFLDCRACGYESCERMAIAIFNGLNKPENCHHTRYKMILEEKEVIAHLYRGLTGEINTCHGLMDGIRTQLNGVNASVREQSASLDESSAAIKQMLETVHGMANRATERKTALENLIQAAGSGEKDMRKTVEAISIIADSISEIGGMVGLIDDIASRTDLLSFNAAIEAAHAGEAGRGFAVVAGEIKNLANGVSENAQSVNRRLDEVMKRSGSGNETMKRAEMAVSSLVDEIRRTADGFYEMLENTSEMSLGSGQISNSLEGLSSITTAVNKAAEGITKMIEELGASMDRIAKSTERTQEELTASTDDAV